VIKAESNPISESLRIQQLSPQTRRADLETAFGKWANIKSAVVMEDKVTKESRCYGYVNLYNKKDAEKCKDKLDNTELRGSFIRVYYSNDGVLNKNKNAANNNNNTATSRPEPTINTNVSRNLPPRLKPVQVNKEVQPVKKVTQPPQMVKNTINNEVQPQKSLMCEYVEVAMNKNKNSNKTWASVAKNLKNNENSKEGSKNVDKNSLGSGSSSGVSSSCSSPPHANNNNLVDDLNKCSISGNKAVQKPIGSSFYNISSDSSGSSTSSNMYACDLKPSGDIPAPIGTNRPPQINKSSTTDVFKANFDQIQQNTDGYLNNLLGNNNKYTSPWTSNSNLNSSLISHSTVDTSLNSNIFSNNNSSFFNNLDYNQSQFSSALQKNNNGFASPSPNNILNTSGGNNMLNSSFDTKINGYFNSPRPQVCQMLTDNNQQFDLRSIANTNSTSNMNNLLNQSFNTQNNGTDLLMLKKKEMNKKMSHLKAKHTLRKALLKEVEQRNNFGVDSRFVVDLIMENNLDEVITLMKDEKTRNQCILENLYKVSTYMKEQSSISVNNNPLNGSNNQFNGLNNQHNGVNNQINGVSSQQQKLNGQFGFK